MSTNIYESEQHVAYSKREPTTYYGWYFSWAGGEDDSVYPFGTDAHRQAWVSWVGKHFGSKFDRHELEDLAALLALDEWGGLGDGFDMETCAEWVRDAMSADQWDVCRELASGFDICTGEPREPEPDLNAPSRAELDEREAKRAHEAGRP